MPRSSSGKRVHASWGARTAIHRWKSQRAVRIHHAFPFRLQKDRSTDFCGCPAGKAATVESTVAVFACVSCGLSNEKVTYTTEAAMQRLLLLGDSHAQSRFAHVKGAPLHYLEEGAGEVVVLVHGGT